MSRDNGGWPRLPLERMSDIELLMVFEDAADGDGGATSHMVAERTDEGVRAARAIGGRFSWLARWGFMEQDESTRKWYLTQDGMRLRSGVKLTSQERRQAQRLARATLGLGNVLGQSLDPDSRRMLRRQFQYSSTHDE